MRHRQRRLSAEASLGFGGSVPDRGKGAFDGVRRSDVFPDLMIAFNVNWTGWPLLRHSAARVLPVVLAQSLKNGGETNEG